MSEEFLKIASKEINDEILEIQKILSTCRSDSDIFKNANAFDEHFHKIKGLAPMMGQEKIGKIAEFSDKLLKEIIAGNNLEGIYKIISESHKFMSKAMRGHDFDFELLKQQFKNTYSEMLI